MVRALAVALALALLLAGWIAFRLSNEQEAHAETRAAHALQIAALERAAKEAEANARAEEQRRTAEVQKVADEARQELDRARADAVAAADAGSRLRSQIAAITAGCRAAASHPQAASGGPPADAAADLLADVQRRLGEATERIAAYADTARAAGAACERSYDALTR